MNTKYEYKGVKILEVEHISIDICSLWQISCMKGTGFIKWCFEAYKRTMLAKQNDIPLIEAFGYESDAWESSEKMRYLGIHKCQMFPEGLGEQNFLMFSKVNFLLQGEGWFPNRKFLVIGSNARSQNLAKIFWATRLNECEAIDFLIVASNPELRG